MQAPAQGAQAIGQAPTDAATARPSDMAPNNTSSTTQSSAPARSRSGESGIPMTGLGNGHPLNLFPGILVPFAILLLGAGLALAFLLRRPRQPRRTPGFGSPRFQPAAAGETARTGEMQVTHHTPTPGLSLTAVAPPEAPEPPPPPSAPILPPLLAPGASVFIARDGKNAFAENGSTGLNAQPRPPTPPKRL